jgi:hypothetical protein
MFPESILVLNLLSDRRFDVVQVDDIGHAFDLPGTRSVCC